MYFKDRTETAFRSSDTMVLIIAGVAALAIGRFSCTTEEEGAGSGTAGRHYRRSRALGPHPGHRGHYHRG